MSKMQLRHHMENFDVAITRANSLSSAAWYPCRIAPALQLPRVRSVCNNGDILRQKQTEVLQASVRLSIPHRHINQSKPQTMLGTMNFAGIRVFHHITHYQSRKLSERQEPGSRFRILRTDFYFMLVSLIFLHRIFLRQCRQIDQQWCIFVSHFAMRNRLRRTLVPNQVGNILCQMGMKYALF